MRTQKIVLPLLPPVQHDISRIIGRLQHEIVKLRKDVANVLDYPVVIRTCLCTALHPVQKRRQIPGVVPVDMWHPRHSTDF